MSDNIRPEMPLFPISVVKDLTQLSARQIRYYEEHQLIHPARTEGNRRLFSFNDIDKLLEIKKLVSDGVNMAGVKEVLKVQGNDIETLGKEKTVEVTRNLTDGELRKMLKEELFHTGRFNKTSLRQGELSRFFH